METVKVVNACKPRERNVRRVWRAVVRRDGVAVRLASDVISGAVSVAGIKGATCARERLDVAEAERLALIGGVR